eukprot:scaffold1827_cov421-Prasinococcus_capsulatus_cf.AAC.34
MNHASVKRLAMKSHSSGESSLVSKKPTSNGVTMATKTMRTAVPMSQRGPGIRSKLTRIHAESWQRALGTNHGQGWCQKL